MKYLPENTNSKNLRPKKSLGQNFLKSAQALRDIIRAGDVTSVDTILEIGPGRGALTEALLETGARVIAIEKDRELFGYLAEKFQNEIISKKLILVEEDILEFDLQTDKLLPKKYKLIANIPYNITGAIFRKFLGAEQQPERMILLVQKEVAERIVARDKKESILSIAVKVYGTPKIIVKVPARYFSPAPKVDSAIIAVTGISRNNLKTISEELFFEIVRAGFTHKRKVLIRNLEELKIKKELLNDVWIKLGLSPKVRAEELGIGVWIALAKELKK